MNAVEATRAAVPVTLRNPSVTSLVEELQTSLVPLADRLGCRLAFENASVFEWLTRDDESVPHVAGEPLAGSGGRRAGLAVPVVVRGESLGVVRCVAPAGDPAIGDALRNAVALVAERVALHSEEQRLLEALAASWEHLESLQEFTACNPLEKSTDGFLKRIIDGAGGDRSGTCVALWIEKHGTPELHACIPAESLRERRVDPGWLQRVLRDNRCLALNDGAKIDAWRHDHPRDWPEAARILVAPVASRHATRGVLVVWNARPGTPYDSHLLRQARALALQALLAVEVDRLNRTAIEAKLLQQELEIGAGLQQTLLSGDHPSEMPHVRIASLAIASQQVGGDFLEVFQHSPKSVDVMIGDVMGKGLKAALVGVTVSRQFHKVLCELLAANPGDPPDPAWVITSAARDLVPYFLKLENFVTLIYARIDHQRRRFEFVDCGHPPVLHYHRADGRCRSLLGENMPLGFFAGEVYRQVSVAFEPGDVFLFYSDGVTEALNPECEQFGDQRLTELVEAHAGTSDPETLVQQIRASVEAFAGTTQLQDDFTCVVVRTEAEPDQPERPVALSVEVDSDLSRLNDLRAFAREVCTRCDAPGPDEAWIGQLELAVTEAASNIMIHAYGGHADRRLRAEGEVWPDRVVIRLIHQGHAFDPATVRTPVLDGTSEGGLGVFLIGECVDAVSYTRDGTGAGLTVLTKTLPGAAEL